MKQNMKIIPPIKLPKESSGILSIVEFMAMAPSGKVVKSPRTIPNTKMGIPIFLVIFLTFFTTISALLPRIVKRINNARIL